MRSHAFVLSVLVLSAFVVGAQAQDASKPESIYAANCASCHGADRKGKVGVPDLSDKIWIWGGDVANIETTIRHGIRSNDPQARAGVMPGFKHNDAELTDANIADLIEKIEQLSGRKADAKAVERAEENWVWCVACHGERGEGVQAMGGPSLIDKDSLYGNDKKSLALSIGEGRKGICPGGDGKLDETSVKALAKWLANGK